MSTTNYVVVPASQSLQAAVKATDLADVFRATVSAATNRCLTRLLAFGVLQVDQYLALQEANQFQGCFCAIVNATLVLRNDGALCMRFSCLGLG